MKNWLRPLTYVLAALCGIAAAIYPAAASVLVPVATGLAGWGTKHPADATAAEGAVSGTKK